MCGEVTVYFEAKIPSSPLMSHVTLDKLLNIFKCAFTYNAEIKINLYHEVVLRAKFNE